MNPSDIEAARFVLIHQYPIPRLHQSYQNGRVFAICLVVSLANARAYHAGQDEYKGDSTQEKIPILRYDRLRCRLGLG